MKPLHFLLLLTSIFLVIFALTVVWLNYHSHQNAILRIINMDNVQKLKM